MKYTKFDEKETSLLNSASIQDGIDALESYVEVADAFTQAASECTVCLPLEVDGGV